MTKHSQRSKQRDPSNRPLEISELSLHKADDHMTMVNEFGNSNVQSDSLKSNGSFYNRKINAKLSKPVSG